MVTRAGGCLCGSVRYTVSSDFLTVAVCHCQNCQKQAGSAFSVVAVAPRGAVQVTGTLKIFEDLGASGQPVYRQFCPDCGSPVLTDTPRAQEAGIIFIKAGTLDDVSDIRPSAHYWTKSAQSWFAFPPGTEIFHQE